MENQIIFELKKIQTTNLVDILYACESGSRAWGFPSPDSDYDVRFIYRHHLAWYISLKERDETIEQPVNELLDIGGWDIKKALQLLYKSNAPLLEWIQSPIVYQRNDAFLDDLREVAVDCFSPIAVMHHYLSMSKKYTERCTSGNQVKLKHYFYAIRTTLAASWIRLYATMPPIIAEEMIDQVVTREAGERIRELIQLKAEKDETYVHKREPLIDRLLIESVEKNDKISGSLAPGKARMQIMDDLLGKWVI